MEILEKVAAHHQEVERNHPEYTVVFTSLIGSQNYNISTENSDIDTCSFVLPSFEKFIRGKILPSIEHESEYNDGHCVIKDLRQGLDLLRKPSPNSIEWFLSSYKYYNFKYEKFLKYILENEMAVFILTHANFRNMLDAIVGTAKGLHGRNMSSGKKVSHVIRLKHLARQYMTSDKAFSYLKLNNIDRDAALFAKTSENDWEPIYQFLLNELITYLNVFTDNKTWIKTEKVSQDFINKVELKLFEIYLEENGYEKRKN